MKMLMLAVIPFLLCGAEYPHAYPREGVTKLFENQRITIWEVVWKKGVKQPYHRHRYDMAGVYLRYGPIAVTALDGSVRYPARYEVPRPYFQRKDITHKEEAAGGPEDPEQLAIMIDLKEPATDAKAAPAGGRASSFERAGARNVLENERVRMWDLRWPKDSAAGPLVFERDSVVVFFEGGTLTDRKVAFKDVRFVPAGQVDRDTVVEGSPRAVIVEIK
jgi:hypothetical protein